MAKTELKSRFLIIVMALCFLVMLCSSLYQRFKNPDLTVGSIPNFANSPQADTEGSSMGAIGSLMKQVAQNPSDQDALLKLVETLMSQGQWETAENFAQKAISLSEKGQPNPRALYLLAIIHHNMGRHEQAAELLEKFLEKDENPSARYSLGILYTHYLNRQAEGMEQFRKGIANDMASPSLKASMREELEKAGVNNSTISQPNSEKKPANTETTLPSTN